MATKTPPAQRPATETKPEEKPAEENKNAKAPVETKPEETAAEDKEVAASDTAEQAAQNDSQADEESAEAEKEPVVKSGFYKVQISDFRGSYSDAKFDDHGVCDRISKSTLEALGKQFPGAKVLSAEEVD